MNDTWTDTDGNPTDAYFDAVDDALAAAGVIVEDGRADDDDFVFRLANGYTLDYEDLYVVWSARDGWCWVPVTDRSKGGDRTIGFAELDRLAEPELVAEAVAELMRKGADR